MKFPEGKTAAMMAKEYGVSLPTIRWWARNNNVPCMGGDGSKLFYIFDKEMVNYDLPLVVFSYKYRCQA
jgi:hypothetical protein